MPLNSLNELSKRVLRQLVPSCCMFWKTGEVPGEEMSFGDYVFKTVNKITIGRFIRLHSRQNSGNSDTKFY